MMLKLINLKSLKLRKYWVIDLDYSNLNTNCAAAIGTNDINL